MSETFELSEDLRQSLRFNSDGLIPVVTQDAVSGVVLMMAWMNDEALASTLQTREGTYWSRSRAQLWRKGETSGNTQRVVSIAMDCDGDTLLMKVNQVGPACHTGTDSCFTGRTITLEGSHA